MDHLQQLVRQIRRHLFLVLFLENAILMAAWLAGDRYLNLDPILLTGIVSGLALVMAIIVAFTSTTYVLQPLKALWQAILHIAPGNHAVAAPKMHQLHVGRDLVSSLTAQIYQFATQAEHVGDQASSQAGIASDAILKNLPVPFIVLDKAQTIAYANDATAAYANTKPGELIGKNFYSAFNLLFSSDNTLDNWLATIGTTQALATNSWERVRLKIDNSQKQFDLAAHYSKDNPSGVEVTLALFDHTGRYDEDDQALSFVALSVHELRTPLTLLRGYIEVFEDELRGKLTPELETFIDKMNASAEQLTAFVSNILNVARVENNQLELSLQEEAWKEVLLSDIENLKLRAAVRGITLECEIADNLPPVGVDRVSIYEVLNNLLDNAIKYSGDSKKIIISSQLGKDGLIETTVQDFGVGIPANVMPSLFNKFYRDFRNRAQIGGTGLGLYLCKAIVTAHGGNIWVRSQPGKGATFSFTLLPYAKLADEQKNGNNKGIVRGAHGWIKNHSLYRD